MEAMQINPEVLKWARITTGMELDEAAGRLKIKDARDRLRAWESGQQFPSYSQLETLAYTVYKRPIAIFFFPSPPKEKQPEAEFRTVPDKVLNALPPKIRIILRKAVARQLDLKEVCNDKNPSPKPILKHFNTLNTPDKVRDFLGVTFEKQSGWRKVAVGLEFWRQAIVDAGVFVFKEAFGEADYSGFCIYDDEFPVIFLNNSHSKSRQLFTLLHELGHLILKRGSITVHDLSPKKVAYDEEKLCNKFAGEVLVPEGILKQEYSPGKSWEDLARTFCASPIVVARQAVNAGLVSQSVYWKTYNDQADKWERFQEDVKKKQEKSTGNYWATTVSYLGKQYIDLVMDGYYTGRFSESQTADYLGIKGDQIEKIEEKL